MPSTHDHSNRIELCIPAEKLITHPDGRAYPAWNLRHKNSRASYWISVSKEIQRSEAPIQSYKSQIPYLWNKYACPWLAPTRSRMAPEIRDWNLNPSNKESVLRACDQRTGICLPSVNGYSFGTETINASRLSRGSLPDSGPYWAKSIPVYRPKWRKNPTL